MQAGYAKRGRGYGRVEVAARYRLPATEAVRYRWPATDEHPASEWVITESVKVLTAKPPRPSEARMVARYKALTAALTTDWQTMTQLQAATGGAPGVWSMCKALEREEVAEVREVHFKPNCRGARAWRSEARKKP